MKFNRKKIIPRLSKPSFKASKASLICSFKLLYRIPHCNRRNINQESCLNSLNRKTSLRILVSNNRKIVSISLFNSLLGTLFKVKIKFKIKLCKLKLCLMKGKSGRKALHNLKSLISTTLLIKSKSLSTN